MRWVASAGRSYLDRAQVRSVGVARAPQPPYVAIRFGVETDEARLELSARVGESLEIEGTRVPTSIVLRPEIRATSQTSKIPDRRKARAPTLQAGLSISSMREPPGTLGAIVYEHGTARPLLLSCWHVLAGPKAHREDVICQPGSSDGPITSANVVADVVDWVIDEEGDCAIAAVRQPPEWPARDCREVSREILDLGAITLSASRRARLGDRVVKSGRTTGVTWGTVECVGMLADVPYGDERRILSCFEIQPWRERTPGELSDGGDSGSVWVLAREDGHITGEGLGVHFAGDLNPEASEEWALACDLGSNVERLGAAITPQEALAQPARRAANPPAASPNDTWRVPGNPYLQPVSLGGSVAASQSASSVVTRPLRADVLELRNAEFDGSAGTERPEFHYLLVGIAAVSAVALWAIKWQLAEPESSSLAWPIPADLSLTLLGNRFVALIFVATMVERAIETILTFTRGTIADKRKLYIQRRRDYMDQITSWIAATGPNAEVEWKPVLEEISLHQAQSEANYVRYRLVTRDIAICLSAMLGLLVAMAGFGALSLVRAPSQTLNPLFNFLDLFVTAGVISGGSEGVHQIAEAVLGFARRSRASRTS